MKYVAIFEVGEFELPVNNLKVKVTGYTKENGMWFEVGNTGLLDAKPLPECTIEKWQTESFAEDWFSYEDGWNDCIDEILEKPE